MSRDVFGSIITGNDGHPAQNHVVEAPRRELSCPVIITNITAIKGKHVMKGALMGIHIPEEDACVRDGDKEDAASV